MGRNLHIEKKRVPLLLEQTKKYESFKRRPYCCITSSLFRTLILHPKTITSNEYDTRGREGGLLGIFGGGAPPGSPSTDPISDQTKVFSIPVSDLTSKIHTQVCFSGFRHGDLTVTNSKSLYPFSDHGNGSKPYPLGRHIPI